ncbi:unnamed protein product [Parajaminaea phylloscopi]
MAADSRPALSAQDLAEFETIGASGTGTLDHQRSPAAPRNPYNPFLANTASAHDDLSQLAEPTPHAQVASQIPAQPAQFAPPAPNPFADGIDAAAALPSQTAARPEALAAQPTATAPAVNAPSAPEAKVWPTKDVIFRGRDRKIVMQNDNGPCSLLALANILLLRGDVELQPPDRPLVTYDYLASLIAEYLLTRPPPAGAASGSSAGALGSGNDDGGALSRALSLLPQTQHGLNLNPSFLSNNSFVGQDGSQHLELFDLLGVELYHGFIPDASSGPSYELLTRAGSYDAALDQVVKGDEVAARFLREAMHETSGSPGLQELARRGGMAVVESAGWGTADERNSLTAALEMSSFLDSNSAQLTYPGLFALSALPEGTLAALFRFNHLSVFYRPRAGDCPSPDSSGNSAPLPPILTLMTDEAFIDEELAMWESLADTDGRDSGEIYDGRFRKRRIDARARLVADTSLVGAGHGSAGEDADYALALQLHSEERERVEQRRQRRQERTQAYLTGNGPAPGAGRYHGSQEQRHSSQPRKGGGLLSSIGLGRKGSRRPHGAPAGTGTGTGTGAGGDIAVPANSSPHPAPQNVHGEESSARHGSASDSADHRRRDGGKAAKRDCHIM